MRTALVALIAFMPTSPNGALGSLDYKKEERRALAIKSREASPKFGTPERQKLIDEVCCLSSTSTDIIFTFWIFSPPLICKFDDSCANCNKHKNPRFMNIC